MEMQITSLDDILMELENYDLFLSEAMPSELEDIIYHGGKVVGIQTRTAKLLADAKYWKRKNGRDEYIKIISEFCGKFTPKKVIEELVDSYQLRENYAIDWAERMNANTTHIIDWCRTLVSKEKEMMRMTGGFNNQR